MVIKRNTLQSQHYTRLTTPSLRGSTKWLPCANYHCRTQYEQSFRHCQHTYPNWKAATDQHPWFGYKFAANYIKRCKAYTTFRNHKYIQRQVKAGAPQGGVLSPTLFNTNTEDIPTPTAPLQVIMYADDITFTSTHTSKSAARKYIQPYLHKVFDCTQLNNLVINPDKTTCTQFTPDAADYNSNLGLNINNKALPMALHPKVLGLTLDPKLTSRT